MALNYISRLPSDLLDLILYRLPVVDYVRSGAVCRSWRRATAGNPHRLDTKAPWLMLPGTCEVSGRLLYRFFSIPDLTQHKHRFSIPQTLGRIMGSSQGIIMIAYFEKTILLDPLSFPSRLLKLFFWPSKSVAVAMYAGGGRYMSFAQVGDRSWTILLRTETYDHLHDIKIHKGEFYAVNSTGTILSFDPAQGAILPFADMVTLLSLVFVGTLLRCSWWCRSMGPFAAAPSDAEQGGDDRIFQSFYTGQGWPPVGGSGEPRYSSGLTIRPASSPGACRDERKLHLFYTSSTFAMEPRRHDFGVFSLENGSIEQLDSLHHIPLNRWAPFWLMRS